MKKMTFININKRLLFDLIETKSNTERAIYI